ncbi:MAG: hypothetical protein AAGU02_08880, partial [Lawsonibacter sp.]
MIRTVKRLRRSRQPGDGSVAGQETKARRKMRRAFECCSQIGGSVVPDVLLIREVHHALIAVQV